MKDLLQRTQDGLNAMTVEQQKQNDQMLQIRCKQFLTDNADKGGYLGKGVYKEYKQSKQQAMEMCDKYTSKGPMADKVKAEYLESKTTEEDLMLVTDKALSAKDKEWERVQNACKQQEARDKTVSLEKKRDAEQAARKEKELVQQEKDFNEWQKTLLEKHNTDMVEKQKELKRLEEDAQWQAERLKDIMESQAIADRSYESQQQALREAYKQHTAQLMQNQKEQDQLRKDICKQMQVSEIKGKALLHPELQQQPKATREVVSRYVEYLETQLNKIDEDDWNEFAKENHKVLQKFTKKA